MLFGGLIDGISYSFMITSIRQLAVKIAPRGLHNSAMSFCDMAFFSVSYTLTSYFGGRIIDNVSTTAWAFIATAVGVVSAVTGIIYGVNFKKYQQMAERRVYFND